MKTDFGNVQEFPLLGGRLLIAPMKTKDVIAVEGSVLGGANMLSPAEDVIPALVADLLDAGTNQKSKDVIRNALAARGIALSFASSGDRTYFSAQCFPEDLSFLFSTIAECLQKASFPIPELRSARSRFLGELAIEKTETRPLAERALSRLLYDPAHVNYSRTIREEEESVKNAARSDLSAFRSMIGKGGLVLAVTGDTTPEAMREAAEKAFAKLPAGITASPAKERNRKAARALSEIIPVPNKANIDVLLGASLPFTKKDAIYHPFLVLSNMLGGGFAGHLMQTIRERDGLTYGVYSMPGGFEDGADGFFRVWATFSPELYEKSVEALRRELTIFMGSGLTDDALTRTKDELVGSYLVGLSTTRGMARRLHAIGTDGRDLSYLTEYPDVIRTVSISDIQNASHMIPLDVLSLAASGTFPK